MFSSRFVLCYTLASNTDCAVQDVVNDSINYICLQVIENKFGKKVLAEGMVCALLEALVLVTISLKAMTHGGVGLILPCCCFCCGCFRFEVLVVPSRSLMYSALVCGS